ncbi:unnamed protein product [Gongylonema pulchrum]|uniref:Myosin_tail_1 domain-containing protein n=1 Tax=Gongylonema pulchrum TaxID=637853 RepID=A0A183DVB7_9BILA|nr:unnamed protein product [Gongylonema pulchrum]
MCGKQWKGTDKRKLLSGKLQTLIANARNYKVATTQTVLSGDTKQYGYGTSNTSAPILELLQREDPQLINRISDLIQQKLKIQKINDSELELLRTEKHKAHERKILNERLDDSERETRKLKVDSVRIQAENRVLADENKILKESLAEKRATDEQLRHERKILNERLDDSERATRKLKVDSVRIQAENRVLADENKILKESLAEKRATDEQLRKSVNIISELRNKLKKANEVKELILHEFRHLEKERDQLLDAINDGIHEVETMNRMGSRKLTAEIARIESHIPLHTPEKD